MEEKLITNIEEPRMGIVYNLKFLEWFFQIDKKYDDKEKEYMFNVMSYASLEEPYIFMRIILYIANTRSKSQELHYKQILHFLCVMYPEWILANLHLLLSLGSKNDILFLIQSNTITPRLLTWVKHQAKIDPDFAHLMTGEVIDKPIKRVIRYKPKLVKNTKWSIFLNKILDDPKLNGIALPTKSVIEIE